MVNARIIRSEKGAIFLIRDDISLRESVIPGLTKPALVCPVLDTGESSASSVFPLEFTPYLIRGRNDSVY